MLENKTRPSRKNRAENNISPEADIFRVPDILLLMFCFFLPLRSRLPVVLFNFQPRNAPCSEFLIHIVTRPVFADVEIIVHFSVLLSGSLDLLLETKFLKACELYRK